MSSTSVRNDALLAASRNSLRSTINDSKVVFSAHNRFSERDVTGRMITYFTFKQIDHAISVTKLDPSMDAVLISRTMVEGLINLTWMLEKPETRVKDWFDYAAVANHELLLSKKEDGHTVSKSEEAIILAEYARVAGRFMDKHKKNHKNYRAGVSIKSAAENNNILKSFYNNLYKYFSDWAHWGPQSLHHAVALGQGDITYYDDYHEYLVPSLVAARHCLYETIIILNDHFKLGQTDFLKANYDTDDKAFVSSLTPKE